MKFSNLKKSTAPKILSLSLAMYQANSFALGGLDKAKSAADDIKTGLFALVGVLALVYMIYLGVMAFAEKKSWSDFGMGVVYVSLVGGSVALGNWAWTLLV